MSTRVSSTLLILSDRADGHSGSHPVPETVASRDGHQRCAECLHGIARRGSRSRCRWRFTSPPRTALSANDALIGYRRFTVRRIRLPDSVPQVVRFAVATIVFCLAQTISVAAATAFSDDLSFLATWRSCFFWTMPHYLGGAVGAYVCSLLGRIVGWQTLFVSGPIFIAGVSGVSPARLPAE